VLVYDDAEGLPVAARTDAQDGLDTVVVRNGETVNYTRYLLRDACVAPVAVGGAYLVVRPWEKHAGANQMPPLFDGVGPDSGILSMAAGHMRHSRFFHERRMSNARCWTATCIYCPDYRWDRNFDPDQEDGSWAMTFLQRVEIGMRVLPDPYADAGLGVFSMAPWVFHDVWRSFAAPLAMPYAKHGLAGATVGEVYRCQYTLHELLHVLCPDGEMLPTTSPPGRGWDLYSAIVPGVGGWSPAAGRWEGHHGVPGISAYHEYQDPVSSPALNVEWINNVLDPPGGRSEPLVSPYLIRLIKAQIRAPRHPRHLYRPL
jgi:hypothetical protein